MRKKTLALILGAAALAGCAFGFAACDTNGSGSDNKDKTDNPHDHVWVQTWDKNGTHHWHNCEGCDEKNGYDEHGFDNGDCVCGQKKPEGGEKPPVIEPEKHTHEWAEAWDKDDTHHWHNCTGEDCDEKDGYGEHDFDNGDCVCGEKAPHDHAWAESWSSDGTHHWHGCEVEGCEEKDGYAAHDFTHGDCECGKPQPATEGLAYELNSDGTAYICTGIGTATDAEIRIASEYENLPVTGIKESAFSGNQNLAKVFIPQSIETVGQYAFGGCDFLLIDCEVAEKPEGWANNWYSGERTDVYFNCKNDIYEWVDGILYTVNYNNNGKAGLRYACKNLTGKIVIPSELTFNGVVYKVTSIGSWAFYGCTEITEVVTTDTLVSIGSESFKGCTSLESLTLPFAGVNIYNNESTLDYSQHLFGWIFGSNYYEGSYCASQSYVKYVNSTRRVYTQKNYIPTSLKNVTILGKNSFGNALEYGAFSGIKLDNLTLMSKVKVDSGAFYIKSATVQGESDFVNCKVKNLIAPLDVMGSTIPKEGLETLTFIEPRDKRYRIYSLNNCTELTTLNLTNLVQSIDANALSGCTALTDINFDGTMEEWEAVEKGENWDKDTGDYTVHCTDGDIAKNQ